MPSTFDPYREWLGVVLPDEAAPSHYELLGVSPFTSDTAQIAAAAERQMGRVLSQLDGGRAPLAQRVYSEVSTAKLILSTPSLKAAYDTKLRSDRPDLAAEAGLDVPPPKIAAPTFDDVNALLPPTAGRSGNGAAPVMPPVVPPQAMPPAAPIPVAMPPPVSPASYGGVQMPVVGSPGVAAAPGLMATAAAPDVGSAAAAQHALHMHGVDPSQRVVGGRSTGSSRKVLAAMLLFAVAVLAGGSWVGYRYIKNDRLGNRQVAVATRNGDRPDPKTDQTGSQESRTNAIGASKPDDSGSKGAASGDKPGPDATSTTVIGSAATPADDDAATKASATSAVMKPEPAKPEPVKPGPAPPEPPKPDTTKPDPAKPDPIKPVTVPAVTPPVPVPTPPSNPPPVTPAKPPEPAAETAEAAAVHQALTAARLALAKRNFAAAQERIDTATLEAANPALVAEIAQVTELQRCLDEFWKAVGESIKGLNVGEELMIGATPVVVVATGPNSLTIRGEGTNREMTFADMPSKVAYFLAERWLDKKDANSKVFLAAFLATDPKGDRPAAAKLLDTAKQQGADVEAIAAELKREPVDTSAPASGPLPAPDAAAIKKAEQKLLGPLRTSRRLARTPEQRSQVLERILAQAQLEETDAAQRFVLLREGALVAAESGNTSLIDQIVRRLENDFTGESLPLRTEAATKMAEASEGAEAHRRAAEWALKLLEQAVSEKRNELARELGRAAVASAAKSGDKSLVERATARQNELKAAAKP